MNRERQPARAWRLIRLQRQGRPAFARDKRELNNRELQSIAGIEHFSTTQREPQLAQRFAHALASREPGIHSERIAAL